MGRNRLIYTLADYAVVVASEVGRGGTWAGALENQKHGWTPIFILSHKQMPPGNRALIEQGALELPYPFPVSPNKLSGWFAEKSDNATSPNQLQLF